MIPAAASANADMRVRLTRALDKTLDWLGYQPSEAARTDRDLFTAWGRLEAQIWPVAPAGTDGPATSSCTDRASLTKSGL